MDNLNKIIFIISGIIISGALLVLGLYYLNKTKKEKKYSGKTQGKIIDNNIVREEKNLDNNNYTTRRYYYALCEYIVNGTRCVRETKSGTFQPKYKIGQTVTIYYNPNNCHEAYIEGDNNTSSKAIVCLVLGIVALFFEYLVIRLFL